MTQYLLSVWHDADYTIDFSGDDAQRMMAQVDRFNEELQASGSWVFANGLEPAHTATVVRPAGGRDDGAVTTTDGPFAETKEVMGGFWVIEVADLDAALEVGPQGLRSPARARSRCARSRAPTPMPARPGRTHAERTTMSTSPGSSARSPARSSPT